MYVCMYVRVYHEHFTNINSGENEGTKIQGDQISINTSSSKIKSKLFFNIEIKNPLLKSRDHI